MATKNLSEYNAAKVPDASNMTFGIVVSEWNPEITGLSGTPKLRVLCSMVAYRHWKSTVH